MAGRGRLKRAKVRGNQPKTHFVSSEILNGGFRLDVATTLVAGSSSLTLRYHRRGRAWLRSMPPSSIANCS